MNSSSIASPADPRVLVHRDGVGIITFAARYRSEFERLNVAWLEKYFTVEPIDRRVLGSPETEILAPGGEVLFLLLDERVVGTVALKVEDAHTFELTKMAVDEPYQGRGYGQLLLAAALDLARERGARRVILYSQRRLAAAISVYRKAGFVERSKCGPQRYARCDIEMEKDLDGQR